MRKLLVYIVLGSTAIVTTAALGVAALPGAPPSVVQPSIPAVTEQPAPWVPKTLEQARAGGYNGGEGFVLTGGGAVTATNGVLYAVDGPDPDTHSGYVPLTQHGVPVKGWWLPRLGAS